MLPFHNRRYILQLSEKKVWQGVRHLANIANRHYIDKIDKISKTLGNTN